MDASTTITATGTSQSATQNPQNIGAPSLLPSTSSLQAGGSSAGTTNLNTSASVQGIPLATIATKGTTKAQVFQPKTSNTSYLVGAGLVIIILAVIGLVVSNIITGRRLAID